MKQNLLSSVLLVLAYIGSCRSEENALSAPGTSCNCGWVNNGRIVGGDEAQKNKYPMIASIEVLFLGLLICGGTVISPWHILTAAHCSSRFNSLKQVRVGAHRIRRSGKVYHISKFINHEQYDKDKDINDIAIIVTKKRMEFSQNVGPACLPKTRLSIGGQRITALGWGDTTDGGSPSKVLREVELRLTSSWECSRAWSRAPTNSTLCSYARDKDTCQGDSGGPLLWLDPQIRRYTLVALVSYGSTCGGPHPGVNTDVSAYLQWINNKVQETKPGERTCSKI